MRGMLAARRRLRMDYASRWAGRAKRRSVLWMHMPSPLLNSLRSQVSAGGVIYRYKAGRQIEIALIAHRKGESWRLPKGRTEPGETLRETALREVYEETGLCAEIISELQPIEYCFWWQEEGQRIRYCKKVYFYLMRYLSGDISRHDLEVEDVRWFQIERARQIVAYRQEQEVIDLALQRMQTSRPRV
jgi:8-oxo-dGTP pyrophosphatase MutT (NUDIX family)